MPKQTASHSSHPITQVVTSLGTLRQRCDVSWFQAFAFSNCNLCRRYTAAIGTFLALTVAPDEFAATHPFEPHLMSFGREHRWQGCAHCSPRHFAVKT
jgi:hypothetical protein